MPEQTLQPSELSAPKLRPTAEFPSIFSSRTAWEIKQISIGWFVAMNLVDLNLVDLWDCITYFFLNQTAVPISQVSSSENCQQSLLKILRCTVSSFNQNGQKNKIETKSNQIQYKMTLHSLILSKQCVFSWHQAWDVSFPNGFRQYTMKKKNEWQESKTKFETNVVESVLNQVMWILGFICAMLGKTSMNFHPFLGIWTLPGWFSRETTKNCLKTLKNKFRWYPQQPQRFIFTNFSAAFCEAKRWKHLSVLQNLPDLLRNLLQNSAPKPPGAFCRTFSQTFSGTLLNVTWLWSNASHTFSGTFSGNFSSLLNLTSFAPKPPRLSPQPSLHQSFPGLLRNLLRNPFNLTWLCTKVSWNLLRNLLQKPVELDLGGLLLAPYDMQSGFCFSISGRTYCGWCLCSRASERRSPISLAGLNLVLNCPMRHVFHRSMLP